MKQLNRNVENCVIFELIVFLDVHFIEFDDNKVCHANGVSIRNTRVKIFFFIEAKTILTAKQAQQQQHHWKCNCSECAQQKYNFKRKVTKKVIKMKIVSVEEKENSDKNYLK